MKLKVMRVTTTKYWQLSFVLILFVANILQAQDLTNGRIVSVIDAFHDALAEGDSVLALSYLADDVAILESGGFENKDHYRSGHLAGDIKFAQAIPRNRSEITVQIRGDVAWAYSTSTIQGKMGDREVNSQGAELIILTFEDGEWKIKAIHWSSRRR